MLVYVEDAPYIIVENVVVSTALCFPLRNVLQLNCPLHQRYRYSARANFQLERDSLHVTQFSEVARFRSRPFANDQDSWQRIPKRTAAPKTVTP